MVTDQEVSMREMEPVVDMVVDLVDLKDMEAQAPEVVQEVVERAVVDAELAHAVDMEVHSLQRKLLHPQVLALVVTENEKR